MHTCVRVRVSERVRSCVWMRAWVRSTAGEGVGRVWRVAVSVGYLSNPRFVDFLFGLFLENFGG